MPFPQLSLQQHDSELFNMDLGGDLGHPAENVEDHDSNDNDAHQDPDKPSVSGSRGAAHQDPSEPPDPNLSGSTDDANVKFNPTLEDMKIAHEFVKLLEKASLRSEIEPLDDGLLETIMNPPTCLLTIENADHRLSIDLFLAITNAAEETYTTVQTALLRRDPKRNILTYHKARKLVEQLSGVSAIVRDMCVNSCMAYTGAFINLQNCPYCGESRFELRKKKEVPRYQFSTCPLAPQLQVLWRTPAGAESLKYCRKYTDRVFDELRQNAGVKQSPFSDFFDGSAYLEAVQGGRIGDNDMVLSLSLDGAQLYRNKVSDCWIYIWVVLDHPVDVRYQKRYVLVGSVIPGPNKPKNLDSFLFPGLFHLSALQCEGMRVWNALTDELLVIFIFLALLCADGPAMALVSGLVGHHGRIHCRFYCPLIRRHKPGGSHYYPALLLPDNYNVEGCSHPDVDINALLHDFSVSPAVDAIRHYNQALMLVTNSLNPTQYERNRLATGISKPSILSGLPPLRNLGIPGMFTGNCMHLPCLNLPDLLIPLFRGLFKCDKNGNDSVASWQWAVFKFYAIWQTHGKEVATMMPYIPGSFGRPPRNPAEKISSGYKAWKFLLYLYGLGPCLFYGHLPPAYYENFNYLVRGIRLMLQEDIFSDEVKTAHSDLIEFLYGFEELYIQCPLRRCQVNSLKAMLPDLELTSLSLPREARDLGDGYALLHATDSTARLVNVAEDVALRRWMSQNGVPIPQAQQENVGVVRWAHLCLPNGQTARSRWVEERSQLEHTRISRNVKICLDGQTCFAEIHFFLIMHRHSDPSHVDSGSFTDFPLAVVSMYGLPDKTILKESLGNYYTVQHKRDIDVRVIDVKSVQSVVMMAPDPQYHLFHCDGTEENWYFLMEKPGLKISCYIGGPFDDDDDDSNELDTSN
ncbi:hypothetical protein FISHEDRAFT_64061 [Fistulina hepatica ATCC 64428]|uniref:Transposase domain-containing protein n=1 Tax=Fistulina hepatica ATCC 64428 TaxID=1128425 RepID=A0A0D7AIP5_9AGAR|nr:hypothetical protein FISHEDRAFT_64061 [Fistulina hepatica ATCC 64428]